jgi:CRP-like cAMP-binding protein
MYDLFFKNFTDRVPLKEEEKDLLKTYLTPKKIRKKQYLLQEGDVCKYIAFVEKGALREYTIEESGVERIFQFAIEGWTISDLYSFLTGEEATYNIDAVEDSELVMISRAAYDELLVKLPAFETFIRLQLTGAYIAMQKRITSIISLSLDERYKNFSENYPGIVQRFPQHMIASFMGLTPETLSRVRRKIASR